MSEDSWAPNVGARYDAETGSYHASYRPDEPGSLVGAILCLVSKTTGTKLETLDPLYEVVDSDALGGLFRSREEHPSYVEFRYCGCEVTVWSDREVSVSCIDDDE